MKQTLLWLCAGVVLTGCGQKGPLYLPDKNASVVTRPAAPQAVPNGATPAAPKTQDKDDSQSQDQPAKQQAQPPKQ